MLIMSVPSPTSSSSRSTAVSCACSSSSSSHLNKKRSLRISLGGFSSLTSSQKLRFRPLVCSVKAVAMAEVVEDKESVSRRRSETGFTGCSRTFLDVRTEEELLSGIKKEKDRGRLSRNVALLMEELYHNYRIAVLQSRIPNADHTILSNMAVLFDRILVDMEEPFTFSSHHKAIREPFDYYLFGQNYIRPLVDFRKSYIGNMPLFSDIEDKVRQGHNVVFISNHQTEADPAVIALLLETTNAYLSEKMTYIAGDRVITDPLCKPFSMGRNLICVYSKKHMHDAPELFELKKRANARSLKEMALLLRHGSQLIWIAPSGGRDRPDPQTGEWFPAPFDASSVDNMRRLAEHSGVPSHIYPMALLCHDIMPPPPQVEKQIGERRLIGFSGTGLSVAPEMLFQKISLEINNADEAKDAFAIALYDSITDQYNVLNSAIHEDKGIDASNSSVVLSQPWKSRYT